MAETRGLLERRHEPWVTAPSFLWLVALFAVPAVIVFAIALRPSDPWGGIGAGWTLGTLRSLGNPAYPAILWRTLWLSALTTALSYLLNIHALRAAESSQVAIFTYLQPLVAGVLAWGLAGERLTLRTGAAALLIFVGVALVQFGRGSRGPLTNAGPRGTG